MEGDGAGGWEEEEKGLAKVREGDRVVSGCLKILEEGGKDRRWQFGDRGEVGVKGAGKPVEDRR